ncbi:MAG: RNA polymerase sigma factor [Pseudomonadota bacterium]
MKQRIDETAPADNTATADLAPPSDASLVDRVRAGDAVAFELIMRRYNQRLYRLARSILRNGLEAEDVVQEAYVRAYEKIDGFVGPDGFSAWLSRIAVNEALGRLRKRGRVISLDDYVAGNGESAPKTETMRSQQPDRERLAASSELRPLLEGAIDALPDHFRAVFVLRAVEGLSTAETAACLSIPPQTVKTRHYRARRHLQDTLGARFDALMPATFAFGGEHCDSIVRGVLTRIGHQLEAVRCHTKSPAGSPSAVSPVHPRDDGIFTKED